MRRITILISAVAMQMCLGATYSWSVYVGSLKHLAGLNQASAQIPFTVFYFAFPVTMVVTGMVLLPRLGPRFCAVAGGLTFGGGWLLASLGKTGFAFTVLGIGLLGGIGAGVAYLVPITVCIQWFPRHKGMVTGIAVAGFGGGAALVSFLSGAMIDGLGKSPFEAFALLGAAFLVLIPVAGLSMQRGPGMEDGVPADLSFVAIVRRREFRVLYLAMVTGLAAGFAVNANLRELYRGNNIGIGVLAVSLFAVGNASGRIIWGAVFDRIRSSHALQANLILQAVGLVVALVLVSSSAGFLLVAFLVGFNYGGILVLYASAVAQIWGGARVPQVYGLLFSANIPAAVAPVLAGLSYESLGSFDISICCLSALMLSAALLVRGNAAVLDVGENRGSVAQRR